MGVLTLALVSCKKEELPVIDENEPVFHLKYQNEQGDQISINAGDNDWVLETGKSEFLGFESSYGQFYNENTSSYLRVDYFYDSEHQLSNNYNNLQEHFSLFQIPNEIIEKFIFRGDLDNVQSIQWSVNGSDFSPLNLGEIQEPGQYEVCLQVNFSEGCTRTLCNTFYLCVPNQIHARYSVSSTGVEKLCEADIVGTYDQVKWYVDGVYLGQGSSISIDSLSQGFHEVSMRVLKNGVEVSRWNKLLSFGNVLCEFRYFDVISQLQGEINSGVVVSYRNDQGEVYFSTLADQSISNLSISGVELYEERNANGDKVIRFLLNGDVTLESVSGEEIELKNIKATTGLAL